VELAALRCIKALTTLELVEDCPHAPPQKHGWVHYPFQYRPLQMSDSDSTYPPQRSSLILFFATAALSLIPDDVLRYSSLGVVLTSLGIYAAHRKRPLARLDALNDRIKAATDILARARSECLQDRSDLDRINQDLLRYVHEHPLRTQTTH
jgi:hypothetical protein